MHMDLFAAYQIAMDVDKNCTILTTPHMKALPHTNCSDGASTQNVAETQN